MKYMRLLILVLLLSVGAVSAQERTEQIEFAEEITAEEVAELIGEDMLFNISYSNEVRGYYYLLDPDELYGATGHIFLLHSDIGILVYRIFEDDGDVTYTSGIVHPGEYDFQEVRWAARVGQIIYLVAVENDHAWMVIVNLDGCGRDFCPYGPSGMMIVRDARQLGAYPEFADLANMYPEMNSETIFLTTPDGMTYELGVITDNNSLLEGFLEPF